MLYENLCRTKRLSTNFWCGSLKNRGKHVKSITTTRINAVSYSSIAT